MEIYSVVLFAIVLSITCASS